MVNFRILGLVLFFLTIIFLGVVAVRSTNIPSVWLERVPLHGELSSSRVDVGLTLAVRGSALELAVPDCNSHLFPEKFFLHIYQENSDVYINLDFNLAQEKAKRVIKKGVIVCQYKKAFRNLHAHEVVVGQFDMPKGKCCNVLWSRTFYPSNQ